MRILGIDYGTKKIGLAFGDSEAGIAVPLDVVPNVGEQTLRTFAEKVSKEDIDVIVVGVPLQANSAHSTKQLEATRAFIEGLRALVGGIPVHEEDESFTTAESIRLQREEGAQADEDALAAMLIVQAFIDRSDV